MGFGSGSIFSMSFTTTHTVTTTRTTKVTKKMPWPTQPKIRRIAQKAPRIMSYLDKLQRLQAIKAMPTVWHDTPLGRIRRNEWTGYNPTLDKDCTVSVLTLEEHQPPAKTEYKSNLVWLRNIGFVCPNCGTDEYLRSNINLMTKADRDKAMWHKEKYGYHCTVCNAYSE